MTHRPPKLPLVSRFIAAGCVAIWLAGVSACNLEALFCCESPDCETVAPADQERSPDTKGAAAADHMHDADALNSPGAGGQSQDSPRHDHKEGSCCSTLYAVVPTAQPAVFSKPAIQPAPRPCLLAETHPASHTRSGNPPRHQATGGDWAFTPEVCLGPAHRSLAPPALRLI